MKVDPVKTQKETLFEAVLNTVSDAIMVIDRDLKVIYQNEAVHKVYGSKIGERCFEAYRGRQGPCENCIILDVIKDGKPRRALRDIQLPDGNILRMAFLIGIFVVAVHHRIILAEEQHLRKVFGEEYMDYCSRVRRYL